MLKIDITKPIHAVTRGLWEGATVTRIAKVLCVVPGSKYHAVVQIDGYFSPMVLDLASGLVQGCSQRIENTPPKMVKKSVTLHTALMISKLGSICSTSTTKGEEHLNKILLSHEKSGSIVLWKQEQELTLEVPEELSALT